MSETRVWTWTGRTRRHRVVFRHNAISGGQYLEVDGEVIHDIKWKYKLTGCLFFKLDGSLVELYISGTEFGDLDYKLTIDAKEQPLHEQRQVSTWVLALPDGLHQIEFEHKSFDILVDGSKVEALGDFLDDGSCYSFQIPPSNVPALLKVIPAKTKPRRLLTTLEVDKSKVRQSELLGMDDEGDDTPAELEKSRASGELGGRMERDVATEVSMSASTPAH